MELFNTSHYAAPKQRGSAHDPTWEEPVLDWEPLDLAVLIINKTITTATVIEVLGKEIKIRFPDYKEEKMAERIVPAWKLSTSKQTFARREAWKLAPILLEKFGAGNQWRSHELAEELNLPLGQISQSLEKLALQGKLECSANWIYSLAPEEGSPSPVASSDCDSQDCATTTNSLKKSCKYGSLESQSTQTSEVSIGEKPIQLSLQLALHANPSPLGENDWGAKTNGTVSPSYSKESADVDPGSALLKTCQDCSRADGSQEALTTTSINFSIPCTKSGTMRNGFALNQQPLERRGKESACSSLPTPTALSSHKTRSPGANKLTNCLREKGAIASNQFENPTLLEIGMGLPIGWTNPREPRTAQEFLGIQKEKQEEKLLETDSTPTSPQLDCEESYICKDSWNPKHFGRDEFSKNGDQLTIFYKCDDKPPMPEDYKNLEEFEQAWREWEIKFPELSEGEEEELAHVTPGEIWEQEIENKEESILLENTEEPQILLEKWEEPYLAEPREAVRYAKGQTGQLYKYGQRKKITTSPDSHWYWGYSYQIWDGFKWRSKSKSVPLSKLSHVRSLIEERAGVAEILAFLK